MEIGSEVEVAFVIADLAGFTALTETHGSRSAARLVGRFVEIARGSLAPGARLVERAGDAVLVVAPDAATAVATALALRDGIAREPLFLAVRVGVHAGRVVEIDGAYFGTPLNVTARLAAHACPGQILCTEIVARAAADGAAVEFRSVGSVGLKNIAHPVELLEVGPRAPGGDDASIDPVCRMRVDPGFAAASLVHRGVVHHFCSSECARLFVERAGYAGDLGAS